MRKLLFAITAIAFFTVSAKAQTTSFGLKAGMTAANMKFSGSGMSVSMKSKIGYYAGAFADIGVSDQFSVQPELFYSLLGSKIDVNSGEGSVTGTEDLGYINLPVLLKYNKEGFSAFLGPQISYLLSAKSKSGGQTTDDKSNLKSTDFSGVIGAGYTLTNGFGFDARYQLGLSDIAKSSAGEGTVKNSAFMVGIHYRFSH